MEREERRETRREKKKLTSSSFFFFPVFTKKKHRHMSPSRLVGEPFGGAPGATKGSLASLLASRKQGKPAPRKRSKNPDGNDKGIRSQAVDDIDREKFNAKAIADKLNDLKESGDKLKVGGRRQTKRPSMS